MATSEQQRLDSRLAAIDAFVYRNRHVFTPVGVGAAVGLASWVAHATGWPWVMWVLAGWWWLIGWSITLDQPTIRERVYSVAASTGGAGWACLVAWRGLDTGTWLAGVVLLVGLGLPWALHHRVRRGVEVDRRIEAWGDGTAVGLPGTKARGTKAGDGWFSFKIRADQPGRYTLSGYRAAVQRIAARFGVRAEAVSFAASDHEGEVEVTIRDKPRPTQHGGTVTEAASIVGPDTIGTTDDGSPIPFAVALQGHGGLHSVCVGVTGSGKSGLINLGAQRVAAAPDAVLCMVDLSPGAQELKAWRPCCYWFADTVDEAERLFAWLAAVAKDRGERSSSRLFEPSPDAPEISVWVDEAATLFAPDLVAGGDDREAQKAADRRVQLVEQGVRVYRKYGIDLHLATQYGDVRALGGSTIQQQLGGGHVAVFRTMKNTDAHRVVPASKGLSAAELPANKPGSLFLLGMTVEGTAQGRLSWLGDDTIGETVEHWRGRQPLPEPELRALAGDHRTGTPGGDSGESAGHDHSQAGDGAGDTAGTVGGDSTGDRAGDAGTVPDFAAAESPRARQRLSPDESRQLVLDTLRGFPDGATVATVAEQCGKSERIVRNRLGELRDTGMASSKGRRNPLWRAS